MPRGDGVGVPGFSLPRNAAKCVPVSACDARLKAGVPGLAPVGSCA
jgi:hypothetical protein